MKKMVFTLMSCVAVVALQAQTWRLVPVHSDDMTATYLSFGYPDDENTDPSDLFFLLWGYRQAAEDASEVFEAEYFKSDPQGMFEFLRHVRDFSAKYKSDPAVSYKFGVKVKTFQHPLVGNYTAVYDPTGRDFCIYKARRWAAVCEDFVAFCKHNGIELKE